MTHADRIETMLAKSTDRALSKNPSGARHRAAWREPQPIEAGIVRLIEAAAIYADSYQKRQGCKIGDEAMLGDCWAEILLNARMLVLKADCGRLNCAAIDSLITEMLEAEGLGV